MAAKVRSEKAPTRAAVPARTSGPSSDSPGKNAPTPKRDAGTIEGISQRALLRHARERLDRLNEIRDAQRLSQQDLGQRDIAEVLRTTQPRVHRMLKAAAAMNLAEDSPEEVILRAAVERSSRDDLVKRLSAMTYTFKERAPAPFEGAVAGSWDQVTSAVLTGLLSRSEYERICDAVQPPA